MMDDHGPLEALVRDTNQNEYKKVDNVDNVDRWMVVLEPKYHDKLTDVFDEYQANL
jgi:hypothetical protein